MDDVEYNYRVTIIKDISHIHFLSLTILNLKGNQLESIEGIACISMAHLEQLYLGIYTNSIGRNHITSVGTIRKAVWPALRLLGLSLESLM
jgi:hypothetical protein